MRHIINVLAVSTAVAAALGAQTIYIPVNAPYAQTLAVSTKNAHPELQKLGIHAIPPGQADYAIVANGIASKIGKKSSAADLNVVATGKPTVKRDEAGKFFDLCLPLSDAAGRPIGITVMEIPFAFAKDSDEALVKAAAVRDRMQAKIASREQLFEESTAALKALDTLALPAAVKGRFDHFGVDLKHNRLFSTPEDYHAVLVSDLVSGKTLAEIPGVGKPHAVLYREDVDRIYVTDGDAGALKIFDGKTYQLIGGIPLAKDADSIGYDANGQRLYVVNGGKDAGQPYSLLSVIDLNAARNLTAIRIDGETLEAMALDVYRPRLYVNNRARNQVAVVDRWKIRSSHRGL